MASLFLAVAVFSVLATIGCLLADYTELGAGLAREIKGRDLE